MTLTNRSALSHNQVRIAVELFWINEILSMLVLKRLHSHTDLVEKLGICSWGLWLPMLHPRGWPSVFLNTYITSAHTDTCTSRGGGGVSSSDRVLVHDLKKLPSYWILFKGMRELQDLMIINRYEIFNGSLGNDVCYDTWEMSKLT